MQPKFHKLLQNRIEKGSERSLLSFETPKIDFWSNDYLGLGRTAQSVSLKSGSGSRLISGNSKKIEEVEVFLATHFQSEASLIFNSGYDANLGLFSSVPQKGDTILYDEFIHASARDGIRLSFANSFSFSHNNLEALEQRLNKAEGTIFVAVESIYSMDGDLAPLKEIAQLCKRFNALLIVDEAHAGAVFGKHGIGLCEEAGIIKSVFARLITFGKGFGAHGAAVLGTNELRNFLINFARSFIYTTALPEELYLHIEKQVKNAVNDQNRERLQQNIAFFRTLFPESKSDVRSPIQIIPIADLKYCLRLAEQLRENGFAVKAILPPTVPIGSQCIRLCIHSFNTEEEILKLKKFF